MLLAISLLLGGILAMRIGLKNILMNRLQQILHQLTVTPWRGMIIGALSAALLQSSTAVSLITIGLVSADYLSFYQSLGIILGANIGTCSTVQLMTLSLPDKYFLPSFLISILIMCCIPRFRNPAMAVAGLLSMFIGISLLSSVLQSLSQLDTVIEYLVAAKQNSLYGLLGGIIITLLFQSSSAATGILMILAEEGIIDLTTAAYVVYGNNIGSCLSSVVISAAAPLAAKRVALSHIALNLLGVVIFWPLTNLFTILVTYLTADFAGQVALLHTLFNILSSLAILPIVRHYARFIMFLMPEKKLK